MPAAPLPQLSAPFLADDWAGPLGLSQVELDAMTELDAGDPIELAGQYRDLRQRFPGLNVLGGCCGTDLRHISAIAAHCFRDG